MVLEILADAGEIVDGVDAAGLEFVGGADAGKEEELRGVNGSAAEQDFPSSTGLLGCGVVNKANASSTTVMVVEKNAGSVGVREDGEIRAT